MPLPGNHASRSSFLAAALFNSPNTTNIRVAKQDVIEKQGLTRHDVDDSVRKTKSFAEAFCVGNEFFEQLPRLVVVR